MSAGLDRLEGWRQALEAAGVETDLVEHGDFTPAGGEAAMRRLLERDPSIDGVFAANSLMASGALGVLRAAGKGVPTDVGVVTFDNDFAAQSATPPLTTVEQPTVEQGRRMVDVLLHLIDGGTAPTVPVFQSHALYDEIIPLKQARTLRAAWCAKGANVTWKTYDFAEHAIGIVMSHPDAIAFLGDRFAGKAVKGNCGA